MFDNASQTGEPSGESSNSFPMSEAFSQLDRLVSPKSAHSISGRLNCLCRPEVADELERIYRRHSWVYDSLAARKNVETLRGRVPVLAGSLGDADIVVKRLFHGGKLGNLWKDRFLGAARIRNHIPLAEFLNGHGIATPRVIFASWRRSWGVVRGEVGFEKLADGVDADRYLFVSEEAPGDWYEKATLIGELVASMHRIEFVHDDLNLMNIYIDESDRLYVLDLDNSSLPRRRLGERVRRGNLARLERSIRKQGRKRARDYVEAVVEAVHDSYETAHARANG